MSVNETKQAAKQLSFLALLSFLKFMETRSTQDVDHFEIKECRRGANNRIEYQVDITSKDRVWKGKWVASETKELTSQSRLVFLEKLPRDHWIFKDERLYKIEQLRALADVEHIEDVLPFLVDDGDPTKLKNPMDDSTLDDKLLALPIEFDSDAGIYKVLSEVIDKKKEVRAKFVRAPLSEVERWNLEADLNVKSGAEKKLITLCHSIKQEDAESLRNFIEIYSDDIDTEKLRYLYRKEPFEALHPCGCANADECRFGECEHFKAYNEDGCLKEDFIYNPLKTVVHECNSKCKCDSTCPNRVVQNGSGVSKEIFSTRAIGLGVRTNEFVRQGTFIGSYAGELIESEFVEDAEYTFSVEPILSKGVLFCIDAKKQGNITRLLNHSCEPNVSAVSVHTKHSWDPVHEVAFFARRDIRKGEELCVHYGEKYLKSRGIDCLCPEKRGKPHVAFTGELHKSTQSLQRVSSIVQKTVR